MRARRNLSEKESTIRTQDWHMGSRVPQATIAGLASVRAAEGNLLDRSLRERMVLRIIQHPELARRNEAGRVP